MVRFKPRRVISSSARVKALVLANSRDPGDCRGRLDLRPRGVVSHSATRQRASPAFIDHQVTDPKTNVWTAFMTIHRAFFTNTQSESRPDRGPIDPLAVATSARRASYGGGGYLRDRLTRQPATPSDLTNAGDSMATTLQDLGISYLAGSLAFRPRSVAAQRRCADFRCSWASPVSDSCRWRMEARSCRAPNFRCAPYW